MPCTGDISIHVERSYIMHKRGSVTLETAIAFSGVLILIVSIVNSISVYRTDILMQRSVSESCEKFAVFAPLSVTASDAVNTMVNALPDSEIYGSRTLDMISEAAGLVTGFDGSTGHNLMELILDGSFGRVMRDDIAAGYSARNGGSSFGGPDSIGVEYELSDDNSIIEVTVTYKVLTVLGYRTRTIYSVIPIYGDWSFVFNGDSEEDSGYSIWSESNFDRGDYFRERYGANLPDTFPVIDAFNDGNAESILSIDLTSPWYYSDSSNIRDKIDRHIDRLVEFNGCDVNIDGENYTITGDSILSRTLTVIIPENSSDDAVSYLMDILSGARVSGVDVQVVRDGISTRYDPAEDE